MVATFETRRPRILRSSCSFLVCTGLGRQSAVPSPASQLSLSVRSGLKLKPFPLNIGMPPTRLFQPTVPESTCPTTSTTIPSGVSCAKVQLKKPRGASVGIVTIPQGCKVSVVILSFPVCLFGCASGALTLFTEPLARSTGLNL